MSSHSFIQFFKELKEHLAELEKIIEDVTKYFPKLPMQKQKPLAFKHIDSLLLVGKVRFHVEPLPSVCESHLLTPIFPFVGAY